MDAPRTPPRATSRFDRARTPPSPTHGPMHEDWQPYSPRRSKRNVGNRYSTGNLKPASAQPPTWPPLQTPAKKPAFAFTPADLFSSPPNSPVAADNKSDFLLKTPHRSGGLKTASHSNAIESLDPSSSARKHTSMLPTPLKTPNTMTSARKHNRNTSVNQTARILYFQPDDPNDVMPDRRNRYKYGAMRAVSKHGLDLDDFSEPDRDANPSFEVYAESHARVPQLDDSEDNPFYRSRATTAPPVRTSPRRSQKTAAELDVEQQMELAVSKDEGIVFMFRGKRVFRRFRESNSDSDVDPQEPGNSLGQRSLKRSVGATAERPLTRSSIKPRLLFPTNNDIDEEAETDVEMSDAPTEQEQSLAPEYISSSIPATPAKTKGGAAPMMSPPVTSRSLRKRNAEEVPIFQDDMPEPIPATQAAVLPTPQRSSKKKKVEFKPVPIFENEPAAAEDDSSISLSPQRSGRKKAATRSTPIIDDEAKLSSAAGSSASSSSASGRSRKKSSPFDSWSRIKKREDEPVKGSSTGAAGRTRRAAASGTT